MTVKTSDLGGSDWADGGILYAADINDTLGAVTMHRKTHTDSTERTTTSGTPADTSTTFTLTHPANSVLLSIYWKASMKASANVAYARLKITGSSLGTLYWTVCSQSEISATASFNTYGNHIDSSGAQVHLMAQYQNTYVSNTAQITPALTLPDTSTTFTVQLCNSVGSSTAYIDEQTIVLTYIEKAKDDA